MKVDSLSVSSVKSFDHCQLQFFISSCLKLRQESGKAANFGIVFHKFFELRAKKEDKSLDDIFSEYNEEHPDSGLLDKDLEHLRELVDTTLAYNNGEFDPRNMEVLEVEKFFEIETGGVKFRGVIDLVVRIDEKTILAIDWKTGNPKQDFHGKIISEEQLYKDPQVRLYCWALYQMFDVESVLFTMVFVKGFTPYTLIIDKDEGWKAEKFVDIKHNKILKVEQPTRNLSWKCNKFCDYAKKKYGDSGQSMCDFFHERIGVDGLENTVANYAVKKDNK